MNKLLLLALVLSFGGCGNAGGVNGKIKEFEGFRDRMCQCADAACGNAVLEEWRTWRQGTKDIKPDDAQKKQIKEIDASFHQCEHKVGAGT